MQNTRLENKEIKSNKSPNQKQRLERNEHSLDGNLKRSLDMYSNRCINCKRDDQEDHMILGE